MPENPENFIFLAFDTPKLPPVPFAESAPTMEDSEHLTSLRVEVCLGQ